MGRSAPLGWLRQLLLVSRLRSGQVGGKVVTRMVMRHWQAAAGAGLPGCGGVRATVPNAGCCWPSRRMGTTSRLHPHRTLSRQCCRLKCCSMCLAPAGRCCAALPAVCCWGSLLLA